jgi:hypothetical protein
MRTEFLFAELFAHPISFFGNYADVKAALVVRGAECYLVQNFRSQDPIQRIEVFAPGLERKLDACVGPLVGRESSYFDTVIIGGLLQVGSTRRSQFSMSNLSLLKLFREKQEYSII